MWRALAFEAKVRLQAAVDRADGDRAADRHRALRPSQDNRAGSRFPGRPGVSGKEPPTPFLGADCLLGQGSLAEKHAFLLRFSIRSFEPNVKPKAACAADDAEN
ncbi:hypothetical protein THIOKS11210007 [Thiocapsa sp. KS1]|nr:hypothetical protein THIOKS11210007 [Thiocapsa sp. KS1]